MQNFTRARVRARLVEHQFFASWIMEQFLALINRGGKKVDLGVVDVREIAISKSFVSCWPFAISEERGETEDATKADRRRAGTAIAQPPK